jgi:hypothetical protein
MTTLLTVLKSGGRYDAVWVERLAAGARRFAPTFERIVCLTDLPLDCAGVETIPLRHGWPGWWSKMEAFRPDLGLGTMVLCDLDTIFAADATALAEPGFATMEDYFHKGRVSSAFVRWEGNGLAFLYERFAADPQRWMAPGSCGAVPNAVHGDQVVIDHLLRAAGHPPRFFQDLHPGLLDFYHPPKTSYGPLIVFIGDAKPDTATGLAHALWVSGSAAV